MIDKKDFTGKSLKEINEKYNDYLHTLLSKYVKDFFIKDVHCNILSNGNKEYWVKQPYMTDLHLFTIKSKQETDVKTNKTKLTVEII